VASVVDHTDASATIAPTDRSIPPPVITNVMPTDTTPMTAASRRMVSALSTLANCCPAVATPTRQRMNSATTSPRLRPTDELISSPTKPPERSRPGPDRVSCTAGSWVDVTLHFLP
jgi:hypothetical protein